MGESTAETVYRDCTLCEAHCGIAVTVDRSTNRVIDLRGDKADPMSRGYVCPKAVGMRSLSEDPDRLRHPVKKVGQDFVEISWEEAFELVTSRFSEIREAHGANAIATYLGNPNAHDFASNLSIPHLVRALGTRWRFSATSVDQLPKMVSSHFLFGSSGAFPVPDIDRTDFFLVLGANPLASNGSLMTAPDMRGRLRSLRKRGGKLVVVDPRRSETADIANQHLPIRPGTDALFLFAMIHVLFEDKQINLGRLEGFTNGIEAIRILAKEFSPEAVSARTGISSESIRQLTRDFVSSPSAVCYGRIGTCTQEFGSLASWLVDVVNILTGNLDRPGGAMFPWAAHAPAQSQERKSGYLPYARWRTRVRELPEFFGELPVAALAEEIDTPGDDRVRALLTVAGNPVCSTPNADRLDRALERLDFMVSVDLYINETTRHADVILPTSAPLERTNYPLAFHALSVRNFAKWSPAVLSPPAGVKHIWEIALEIAGRMNGTDGRSLEMLLRNGMLARVAGPNGICSNTTEEEAHEVLSKSEGPAYLLDGMLRSGKYGEGFLAEGFSLDTVKDSIHGVDLGALRPRLPEMISTQSGKIELAHEILVGDVERLRESLSRNLDSLVLVGRRHVRSNNSWMHNVPALAKGPNRCTLLIHPNDAKKCGVKHGGQARIRSRAGEVVAPVEVSDELMVGVVSLPHGFGHDREDVRLETAKTLQPGVNSNRLTDEKSLDDLSCNAILNGIPVEIESLTGRISSDS